MPFGLSGGATVGTAASGGCSCARSPQQGTDLLAFEIELILCAEGLTASNDATQP